MRTLRPGEVWHSQDEAELGFHPMQSGSRTHAINHDSQQALQETVCQLDELGSLAEALGLFFYTSCFFSSCSNFSSCLDRSHCTFLIQLFQALLPPLPAFSTPQSGWL